MKAAAFKTRRFLFAKKYYNNALVFSPILALATCDIHSRIFGGL